MASLIVAGLASGVLLASAAPQPTVSQKVDVPLNTPNANWVNAGETCFYMTTDYDFKGNGANLCTSSGTCSELPGLHASITFTDRKPGNEVSDGLISSATPEEKVACYMYTGSDCEGYSSAPLTFPGLADLRDLNFDKKVRSWRCHRLVPRDSTANTLVPSADSKASPVTPSDDSSHNNIPQMIKELIQAGVSEFEHMEKHAQKNHDRVAARDAGDVLRNSREKFDQAVKKASEKYSRSTEDARTRYRDSTNSASMTCNAVSEDAWTRSHDSVNTARASFEKATAMAISKYGHFNPVASVHPITGAVRHILTTPPVAGPTPELHATWSHFTTIAQSDLDDIIPAITQAPNATGTAFVFDGVSYTNPVNEYQPSSFVFSAVTTVANTQPKNLLPACRHMMGTNQTFEHYMGVLISERMAQEAQNKALNASFPSHSMTAPNDALLHACESKAMSNVCFEALMQPSKMDQVVQAALLAFSQAADHDLINAWNGVPKSVNDHNFMLSVLPAAQLASSQLDTTLSTVKPTITRPVSLRVSSNTRIFTTGTVTEHILDPSAIPDLGIVANYTDSDLPVNGTLPPIHTDYLIPSTDMIARCQKLAASNQTFAMDLDRVNFARMEYASWSALLGCGSQGLPQLAHVADLAYQQHKGQIAALMEPLYSAAMTNSLAWECSSVLMHRDNGSGFNGIEERLYHLLMAFGSLATPQFPNSPTSSLQALGTVAPRALPAASPNAANPDEWKSCRSKQDPKGVFINNLVAVQNSTIEGEAWLKVMEGDLADNSDLNDTITRASLAVGAATSQAQDSLDSLNEDADMSACLEKASAKYDVWAERNGKPLFADMESAMMELAAEKRAQEIERQLLGLLPHINLTLADSTADVQDGPVGARDVTRESKSKSASSVYCTKTYLAKVGKHTETLTAGHLCKATTNVHPLVNRAFSYPYPGKASVKSCGKSECDCVKCRQASAMFKRDEQMISNELLPTTLGKHPVASKPTKMCTSEYISTVGLHTVTTYHMVVPCKDAPKWMDIAVTGNLNALPSNWINRLIVAATTSEHSPVTSTTTSFAMVSSTTTVTPTSTVHVPQTTVTQNAADWSESSSVDPFSDNNIDSQIANDLDNCGVLTNSEGSGWWWPWSKPCGSETSTISISSTSVHPLVTQS